MNFVDEATIKVQAGNGGHGCLSFRREKYVERGGPDGGDGGKGGDVYLKAASSINTLADFRVSRRYKAESGRGGAGRNMTGRSGNDLEVIVPAGTSVHDVDTGELIADLTVDGERQLVAKGGDGGLGNTRFKSSTNRAPRKITQGLLGEARHLKLELQLLADVGLLGMPNAGKSTLIRAMSSAKPKVADYPFTTLYPNLGVVAVGELQSFVMADIPGLIEGAAEGAGLGLHFLRHLNRTRLLLHIVDVLPCDSKESPVTAFRQIEKEISSFSESLMQKPRWLVLNKLDLISQADRESVIQGIVADLDWQGPVYGISASTGEGTQALARSAMNCLEVLDRSEAEEASVNAEYEP